ncbi:MAG: SRPBCC domain-containing protein [Bacteriovorax sp.]|nr:SRPBCC domain-containing protein [Bacteriovorax sp.]
MIENEEFIITRTFNASRKLLFKVHTDPRDMANWFGPKRLKTEVYKFDLSPGGLVHYSLTAPEGHQVWGRFVYREIVLNEKIVFVSSFSDKDAAISRHPMIATWPLEVLCTVIFTKQKAQTTLTLKAIPINANEIERKTFEEGHREIQKGWTATFDHLEDYLDFVQK